MDTENLWVFIGASSEGEDYAMGAKAVLEESPADGIKLEAHHWLDTVQSGRYPLDNLEKAMEAADFAVFVLTKDDVLFARGAQGEIPRNNVILELGLFTGKLGRDRVFVIGPSDKGLVMPSDYIGIGLETYVTESSETQSAIRSAAYKIRKRIVEASLAPKPKTRAETAAHSLQVKVARGRPLESVGYGEKIMQPPQSHEANEAVGMKSPPPPTWEELLEKGLLTEVEPTRLAYGTDVIHPTWGVGKVMEVGPAQDKGRSAVIHFEQRGEGIVNSEDLYYVSL